MALLCQTGKSKASTAPSPALQAHPSRKYCLALGLNEKEPVRFSIQEKLLQVNRITSPHGKSMTFILW